MLKLLQNKEIFEVIYMFKIGDYVVNLKNGVCKIEDILNMNLSGESKEYYLLIPQNEQNAKVYIPVDAADSRIRLTMDKEQAMALIKKMKDIEEISIENEKERERVYKEILNSRNPELLVSIIKTLYLRKQDRVKEGKKNTAVDEHYFKLAEKHLCKELAFVLQISQQELDEMILKNIE